MIIAILYLSAAGATNCRVVADDVIRMRDLAVAEPAFNAVDGQTVVANSPFPGSVRVLPGMQQAHLAKKYGIAETQFRDTCFERAMRKLDERQLLSTLYQALAIPGAEVGLVDFSRFPAPMGDLVFPRSGLALSPTSSASLWRGYVLYGAGYHFPIWARVTVHARLKRVVATDNLIGNKPVRADQVRIEPLDGVPDVLAPAQALEEVVGKNLLRPVHKGASISLDDISTALTVRRGDRVDVDYQAPALHLRFEAAAEMDGRCGDRIRLRNLQGGNVFEAEVSGKDQARVVTDNEKDSAGGDVPPAGDLGGGSRKEEKDSQ